MLIRFALPPLCLLLAWTPLNAWAQAAAPSPAALSASAAPVPPIIDPVARHLFLQMAAAQKGLHSFAVTIDAQDQSGKSVLPRSRGRSNIAFSAPASASVTLIQGNKTLGQLLSDGVTFTRIDTAHKSYRQDALPAGAGAHLISGEIGNLGLLPRFFIDPSGLAGLLSAPGLVAVARGAIAGPVDGVPIDSVVARIIGSDTAQGTFTFVIGQSDHLLRQVIVQETPPPDAHGHAKDLTHTETVSALQANPSLPASTFAYKPQAGFKKVPSGQ